MNEDVSSIKIEQFLIENGLYNTYEYCNNVENMIREKTYVRGSKCIDICSITEGVLNHFCRC